MEVKFLSCPAAPQDGAERGRRTGQKKLFYAHLWYAYALFESQNRLDFFLFQSRMMVESSLG
jgi:hypothetical protein